MGRSIIADDRTERYIDKLLKENQWYIGVIIGQLTAQKDYVVHLARTPDPAADEVSEENVDEDTGDAAVLLKRKKSIRPATLEELDEKWVSTHAKQVSRMLPGGLNVIGLFALAPPAMLKSAQAKLRQMLFNVHKTLNKSTVLMKNAVTDRILLQIDLATKRLSCSTLDVSDVKNVFTPAEWKVQSGGLRWVGLTSQINVDIPMAVPSDSKSHMLLRQIQAGLTDFSNTVHKSIITIEGAARDPSETLVAAEQKKGKGAKGKGGGSPDAGNLSKSVNVYLPFSSNKDHTSPNQTEAQATINMSGSIAVRAYVSSKATVGDAVQAVRSDILRSLVARCELLCEEFDVIEAGKQGSEVYDPPVRLFCPLYVPSVIEGGKGNKGASASGGDGVEVCDYVFQDEKKDEVRERIRELLDLETVTGLIEAEKSAAEDDTWSNKSSLSAMSSQQSLASSTPRSDNMAKAYIGAAVGGIVAMAATVLSYLYISDE